MSDPNNSRCGLRATRRCQLLRSVQFAAAQSDADSALSQDKVPRAYQGPVKDYFDDLKK